MTTVSLIAEVAATTLNNNTTAMASTTITKRKCHLLVLPAELRLIIYDYYFVAFEVDTTRVTPDSDVQAALLHVCRLIRKEGLDAFEARLIYINHDLYQQGTKDLEHAINTADADWGNEPDMQGIRQLEIFRARTVQALDLEIEKVRKMREEGCQ